jgi:hypothetical protein
MEGNMFSSSRKKPAALIEYFMRYSAMAILISVTFLLLCTILIFSKFGFDQTDEGMYLSFIANPFYYKHTVTQFGYIYHPVYFLFGGSVFALRAFNYLSTYVGASLLCFFTLRSHFPRNRLGEYIDSIFHSLVIGAVSLVMTCFELPQSPSYNSLAFQSLIIGGIGIALTGSKSVNFRFCGDITIGFSLWLSFMAKPTTAVVFCFVVALNWILSNRFRKSAVLTPPFVFFGLLIISAYAIDNSVVLFISRLATALKIGKLLGAQNSVASIFRWDSFPLDSSAIRLLFFLTLALAFYFYASSRWGVIIERINIAACGLLGISTLGWLFKFYPGPHGRYAGLMFLVVPLACFSYVLFERIRKRLLGFSRSRLVFAFQISMLPFAYAFGTDRPYWLNAQGASLFWVLSGAVLVSDPIFGRKASRMLLPISAISCILSVFIISGSIGHPMRQNASLRLMNKSIAIGAVNSELFVSGEFFDYLDALRRYADKGGFKHGTPIIDLTGSSPGVVFALGGVAPGAPWLLGGYPGSNYYANAILDGVDCMEIAQSWILSSPDQAGKLSPEILERYGVDVDSDYEDLGFATRPPTPFPERYRHHLLRPRRSIDESNSSGEANRR